jgi:hypothetical protein
MLGLNGPPQQGTDGFDFGEKTLWLALVLLGPLGKIGQRPLGQGIDIPSGRPLPGHVAGQAVTWAVRLDEITLQQTFNNGGRIGQAG